MDRVCGSFGATDDRLRASKATVALPAPIAIKNPGPDRDDPLRPKMSVSRALVTWTSTSGRSQGRGDTPRPLLISAGRIRAGDSPSPIAKNESNTYVGRQNVTKTPNNVENVDIPKATMRQGIRQAIPRRATRPSPPITTRGHRDRTTIPPGRPGRPNGIRSA